MSRDFKILPFSFLFLKRHTFQLFTKTIKDVQKAWAWGKKITHKGESASEQIVPKGIFLTECKVNSKNLDFEIERKNPQMSTCKEHSFLFWVISSGGTPNIHCYLRSTQTHTHPTPKLCKSIDLYVHYDNQQGLGTLVTSIMWFCLIYARLKALCCQ